MKCIILILLAFLISLMGCEVGGGTKKPPPKTQSKQYQGQVNQGYSTRTLTPSEKAYLKNQQALVRARIQTQAKAQALEKSRTLPSQRKLNEISGKSRANNSTKNNQSSSRKNYYSEK